MYKNNVLFLCVCVCTTFSFQTPTKLLGERDKKRLPFKNGTQSFPYDFCRDIGIQCGKLDNSVLDVM